MPESSITPRSATVPAAGRTPPQNSSTFRHDLRNALAPALLCADVLTGHPDKDVQQNAQTIIEALEKALKLLKKPTSSR